MDILFRATSARALFKLANFTNLIVGLDGNPPTLQAFAWRRGVVADVIKPGKMVLKAEPPPVVDTVHWYLNLRLVPPVLPEDEIDEAVDPNNPLPWEKSRIAKWLKNHATAVLKNVDSVRRPGTTHQWWGVDLANGDTIELIWPKPEHQRRVFL